MRYVLLIWLVSMSVLGQAQYQQTTDVNTVEFTSTDSIDTKRLTWLVGAAGAAYVGTSVGLYYGWYKDYPQSGFHFHDDFGAWRHMDKVGHIFSTYAQAELVTKGLRWTGMEGDKALTYGMLSSLLFQTTIEVMDGFSEQWGFSVSDMAANGVGAAGYYAQEKAWGDQRIRLKNSFSPVTYPAGAEVSLSKGFVHDWLKDYNGQTYWASINVKSFFPDSKVPSWINLAIGYGAENMFGAHENRYQNMSTSEVVEMQRLYPRYGQFYISLDADLSKVKTDSPILKTLLDIVNYLKMPFSTLEINTRGEVKFHLLSF